MVDAELQKGPVCGATERALSTAGTLASAVDGGHGMTGGAKHVSSAATMTVRAGAQSPCALGGGTASPRAARTRQGRRGGGRSDGLGASDEHGRGQAGGGGAARGRWRGAAARARARARQARVHPFVVAAWGLVRVRERRVAGEGGGGNYHTNLLYVKLIRANNLSRNQKVPHKRLILLLINLNKLELV